MRRATCGEISVALCRLTHDCNDDDDNDDDDDDDDDDAFNAEMLQPRPMVHFVTD